MIVSLTIQSLYSQNIIFSHLECSHWLFIKRWHNWAWIVRMIKTQSVSYLMNYHLKYVNPYNIKVGQNISCLQLTWIESTVVGWSERWMFVSYIWYNSEVPLSIPWMLYRSGNDSSESCMYGTPTWVDEAIRDKNRMYSDSAVTQQESCQAQRLFSSKNQKDNRTACACTCSSFHELCDYPYTSMACDSTLSLVTKWIWKENKKK